MARTHRLTTVLLLAAACAFARPVFAGQAQQEKPAINHQHHHHHKDDGATEDAVKENPAVKKMMIPDVQVVNQYGQRLNFYSELVKGKTVAINFVFTSCTTICPPLAATFSKVISLGGARAGRDFHLISISVDPVVDTPERLKAWAAKFNPGPGWTIVTGSKEEISELLKALGGYTPSRQDHSPVVLIGNESKGAWTRAYGLAPATRLLEIIEGAINGSVVEPAKQEATRQ